MDFAEQKRKQMQEYLSEKLFFDKSRNILEYADYTKTVVNEQQTKTIWTEAFRVALNENQHIYVPEGKYYLDDTVVIPSNRKITAEKDSLICAIKGMKVVMFRNADVIDGSCRLVGFDEQYTENIVIEGGIWGTEEEGRAEYGSVGAFDTQDSMQGVHALLFFSGVKNLWVKDVTMRNTSAFALQIGRTENFLIENVVLDNCYGDGVHLNGVSKNGVVFNVQGLTMDDMVALNAYDWDNSTINNGPMENITVSRIFSTGGGCHCMRILAGVTRETMGGIDCRMKDIHISNITGVQTFKLYLQTPSYKGVPEGTKIGYIENITFENIEILKTTPSDSCPNYYAKDLTTGHFGAFEICSNIANITLKNIHFKLDMPEFKDTAHFIMVGPKSCYYADRDVETFDPYLNATVKEFAYKDITVNGKLVENLCDYIKVICFENLYPSKYSTGSGKIVGFTELA